MSEKEKAVESKVETAAAQPQKEAPVEASEVDYEAVIAEKDAKLAKVQQEKENYRKGMLKAKGKLPAEDETDDVPPENWREEARRIAREEYLTTQEAQLQAERDDAFKAVIKRNKELTVALKNRGSISATSAQGSNQDKPEFKTDSFFSPEQIQQFKAKGWDDKKIERAKQNMIKGNQMPKP